MPIHRDELVSALQSAGDELEALIKQVGEARLAEAGVSEAWSVRDILAHITAWQERILAWAVALDTNSQPTPAPWSRDWSEEKINEWIFENNQNRSPVEVLTRWREVQAAVLDFARTAAEADLFERKPEWLNGNSIADSMPGNSYEHIRQHAETIRTWLATRSP
jgi:hypothetical protein